MSGLRGFSLEGKTALISGAAGLLGVEHAAALLESGASVVLSDVSEAALVAAQESLGVEVGTARIITRVMDITRRDVIRAVAEDLAAADRYVDILINNAAIDAKVKGDKSMLETSRLENFAVERWNSQIAVGLTGAFLCSQIFGSRMAENGGGVILNIASDLSVFAPDQRLYRKQGLPEEQQAVKPVTYSVVKTGLIGLTRYLATYWAEKHVRVNALSPGGIYTGQPEEFVTRLCQLIPLGRMAECDEYRSVVQFLCSDASRYMTGQNIVMDGGRSVL